jgi:YVTN family beta-propeller protein
MHKVQLSRRVRRAWLAGAAIVLSTATVATAATAPEPEAVYTQPTYSSPITLSADGKLVWSVAGVGSVAVIRTDTNQLVRKVGLGGGNPEPQSIALDPNNRYAFVANARAGNVAVVRINNATPGGFSAVVEKTIRTGAEPWNIVISPDGKRVFVANSGQDTITVINALTRTVIGWIDLRNSLCNDPDRKRHFQPRGLAVSLDNTRLYVTRFLSFTRAGGKQARDAGKEGLVCRLNINTAATGIGGYVPAGVIRLAARPTGFAVDSNGDGTPDQTTAFPNQLQSIVIRGDRAYLPNIAASPEGPLVFNNSTQAFVNQISNLAGGGSDAGALNLHLGARDPVGPLRLFFANPWAIAFTNQGGAGRAYAVSAGSDLLVKLNVAASGALSFTVDADTTKFIDLNDPANAATRGDKAGKNPQGIVITADGTRAYVQNFVSRNVSVVNLTQDRVVATIRTDELPAPGSQAEKVLVGAEMFFSSRGHFDRPAGAAVSTENRLSSEGWQNCASCHFKGWTDAVVWAFASGPRKSVNLSGSFNPHSPSQQKILNYSGVFDEVQDFEANIRNISGPGPLPAAVPCALPPPATSTNNPNQGLIIGDNGNINVPPCVVNQFTKPNANREQVTVTLPGSTVKVDALDALKLWVQFAVRSANGPLTSAEIPGGVPVADIQQGRALFSQQKCTNCHTGGLWSTSIKTFTSPPANDTIACEINLGALAPPGLFCTTPPVVGNPVSLQYLFGFLRNVGSFNLGVAGGGNLIGANVGAVEKAAPALVAGVSQPPLDALGRDYNNDGKGRGYSVQSLLGAHAVPPYMHNGACESIACVVDDRDHRTANGTLPDVLAAPAQRALVVKYVEGIDDETSPF